MRSRWVALLVMTRLLAAAAAITLLSVHRVTDFDPTLIGMTVAWTAVSVVVFARSTRAQVSPAAWAADGLVAVGLVFASGDWRSPFYVYLLTALVLPVTGLPFRRAVAWGVGVTGAYLVVAILTELDERFLRSTVTLETAATHVMVPVVVTLALAYSSEVLGRLSAEQERTARLAVEAERQRIAWELHDSAKQRVHAAHLVLSALHGQLEDDGRGEVIEHALSELRAATADMDTSVAELRTPLDGRPLDVLLRERARELQRASDAEISVRGALPVLPPLVAAHAYRIAAEALTNAVRHARASRIEVEMRRESRTIAVRDDGIGMPDHPRPGSNGLRSMRSRAETIGADLEIAPARGGGTAVRIELPAHDRTEVQGGTPA